MPDATRCKTLSTTGSSPGADVPSTDATSADAASTDATSADAPSTDATSAADQSTPDAPPPAPTQLESKDLIVGTGAEAKPGDSVTVQYVGVAYSNGKVFDASWNRNQPFQFTLGEGQVIAGWDDGVVGMKVGGRRELIIPADLAYGANAPAGSGIAPNDTLIFVVDLVKVG